MSWTVSIRKDSVILVVDPEIMDVLAAEQIGDAIEACAKKLRSKGIPVCILVNARPLKHDDARARKVILKRTSTFDFDRMAVFGTTVQQATAVNLMFLAARLIMREPLLERIKLFRSQNEAEQWLKDL